MCLDSNYNSNFYFGGMFGGILAHFLGFFKKFNFFQIFNIVYKDMFRFKILDEKPP